MFTVLAQKCLDAYFIDFGTAFDRVYHGNLVELLKNDIRKIINLNGAKGQNES